MMIFIICPQNYHVQGSSVASIKNQVKIIARIRLSREVNQKCGYSFLSKTRYNKYCQLIKEQIGQYQNAINAWQTIIDVLASDHSITNGKIVEWALREIQQLKSLK